MTNVFGYDSNNVFDQSLNTDDSVNFNKVTVVSAIVDNQQLATKLYVDNNIGGGGITYSGVNPATNKIYKANGATGLDAVDSTLSDDGVFVRTNIPLKCLSITKITDSSNFEIGDSQLSVDIMATNGLTSNKVVVNGGTNQQYMMADGSVLEASAQNGNANFYLYNNINGLSVPPPASGDISYNATTLASTTIVYISHLTRNGIDIDIYLALINTLDDLYIQDQNNSINFSKFNITSAPTLTPNSYIAIPVAQVQFGGTGNTVFGVNHDVLVSFFSNLQEVNTRLTALETATQNQTSVPLTTTFNQQVNTPILRVQAIASLTPTFYDFVGIGLGNSVVQINSLNGVTSKKFALETGLSTEFLKGDGTVDTNTYVSSASLLENLNTNRLNNALHILPMTSNILPSGYIASSSGNYTIGTDAWYAFNQSTATYFQSTLNNYNGASGVYVGVNTTLITGLGSTLGDWLQIQLPSVINVASYTLDGTNGGTSRNISTFYFLYSTDNINWIIADTQTAYQWVSPYAYTFPLATPVTAKYFRISVSLVGNTGVVVNRNCIQVNELTLNQPLGTVQVPTLISNKTTFSDVNELVTKGYVATYGSTIIQGMPYNPISGNNLTNTGTKALWYTGITPYATTINGIMMYIDTGGSDTCHFGIYRGYLKAGVGTNPGLNMTLVGQSASSVLLTTGLPYNRVPITVIGGQSLNFTAGEYLTIAFHTTGSNNTFVCSPLGVVSAGLCYTTLSNYSTTTFPATITNSAISVIPSVRICFDLY